MSFADENEKVTRQKASQFKKSEFLNLLRDNTSLELNPAKVTENIIHAAYTHYLNHTTVACLGEDCPICKRNKQIVIENPKTYKDVPGYSYQRMVKFVNVLDLTDMKVCPSCGKEIMPRGSNYPVTCECGQLLTSVQEKPLNKIKILNRGTEFFDTVAAFDKTILNSNKEPKGIENFDTQLLVIGSGRDRKVTPVPRPDRDEVVTVSASDYFDLNNAVIHLSAEEMEDFMRGISIRDIFVARKSSEVGEDSKVKGLSQETVQKIDEAVDKLMNPSKEELDKLMGNI